LTAAKLVAAAALARRESRGGHYRSDYPEPDASRAARTFMTLDQADRAAEAAARPLELAS
jgi:L-aspartate oxidase